MTDDNVGVASQVYRNARKNPIQQSLFAGSIVVARFAVLWFVVLVLATHSVPHCGSL